MNLGMFAMVPSRVLIDPGLSRDARFLYAVLTATRSQDGDSIQPSRDDLMSATGTTDTKAISGWLRELERRELIELVPSYDSGGKRTGTKIKLLMSFCGA